MSFNMETFVGFVIDLATHQTMVLSVLTDLWTIHVQTNTPKHYCIMGQSLVQFYILGLLLTNISSELSRVD